MKNLFKFSARLKNSKFVWNGDTPSSSYDTSHTYLPAKTETVDVKTLQTKKEAYSTEQLNVILARKNNIEKKITKFNSDNNDLAPITTEEKQKLFKLTTRAYGSLYKIDMKNDGVGIHEIKVYMKSVDYELKLILQNRQAEIAKETLNKNKLSASTAYINIKSSIFGEMASGTITAIETKIQNGDQIEWDDSKTFYVDKHGIKTADKFADDYIFEFPNYNTLNAAGKRGVSLYLNKLNTKLNRQKKIIQKAVEFKVLESAESIVNANKTAKTTEKTDGKTDKKEKSKETTKKSETTQGIEKLDNDDISKFVEKFKDKDYKIPWREGNKFLVEKLKLTETDPTKLKAEIKRIQNEAGIYGAAADGMAGTQTFARLQKQKGLTLPDNFYTNNKTHIDNFSSKSILAETDDKLKVDDEKKILTTEIESRIASNKQYCVDCKKDLGEPKKINGNTRIPFTVTNNTNSEAWVAIKNKQGKYDFKESYGTISPYIEKFRSDKEFPTTEVV